MRLSRVNKILLTYLLTYLVKCNFSGKDRSLAFGALIVLFSYGYNKETCNIIEATFLMLHFFALCEIFCRSKRGGGHGPTSVVGTGGSGGSMNRGPRAPGAPSSGATENF